MGEQEREWKGVPDPGEDPPTETEADALPAEEDYLRPHLPEDVFGSQGGPSSDATSEEQPSSPFDDSDPPTVGLARTRDLPLPDEATRREIESAIVQLQRSGPFVSAELPPERIESDDRSLPPPSSLASQADVLSEWREWRPPSGVEEVEGADGRTTIGPAATMPTGQPRTTDYLVLHPFPLRLLACILNFGLVLASPWLAASLLDEKVYYPTLEVIAEVWFREFAVFPATAAFVLALWITIRRWRHVRYEVGYALFAWAAGVAAVTAALVAHYIVLYDRANYLLVIWAAALSLLPLLFSLHINMDPAWVVGRRRYWTGVIFAFAPTLITIGVLAAGVSTVHRAYADWQKFVGDGDDDDRFCQSITDKDGFRPGALAMAVLGRRRDSNLEVYAANCAQSLISTSWTDGGRRGQPLSRVSTQTSGDTLSSSWRENQPNIRLAGEWKARRERLEVMRDFFAQQPEAVQAAFSDRLRAKRSSRLECSNPFRAAENALWRAAGHPDCGEDLPADERIKKTMTWLGFMGSGGAFSDPRLSDLRGDEARDFRKLLTEVTHSSDSGETPRTNDVALIAPVEDGDLDRLMVLRVAPEETGQRIYLVAYTRSPQGRPMLHAIRDDWGTGTVLSCRLRRQHRERVRGFHQIYPLRNQEDGYLVVSRWVRGSPRREFYMFGLVKDPC